MADQAFAGQTVVNQRLGRSKQVRGTKMIPAKGE